MANTGNKLFLFIFLIIFFPLVLQGQEKEKDSIEAEKTVEKTEKQETKEKNIEIKETKQPDVHQKMLEKLNLTASEDHETFFRRGEIVFFIAFAYTYLYQFIIYDQILGSTFRAGAQKGYLADRNLYFAVITSVFLALFVARNDIQKQYYIQSGSNYTYPGVDLKTPYERDSKPYNWYFNFFSWDF